MVEHTVHFQAFGSSAVELESQARTLAGRYWGTEAEVVVTLDVEPWTDAMGAGAPVSFRAECKAWRI